MQDSRDAEFRPASHNEYWVDGLCTSLPTLVSGQATSSRPVESIDLLLTMILVSRYYDANYHGLRLDLVDRWQPTEWVELIRCETNSTHDLSRLELHMIPTTPNQSAQKRTRSLLSRSSRHRLPPAHRLARLAHVVVIVIVVATSALFRAAVVASSSPPPPALSPSARAVTAVAVTAIPISR